MKKTSFYADVDFDSFETDETLEEIGREAQVKALGNTASVVPQPAIGQTQTKQVIQRPRYLALDGEVCNPWLDDGVPGNHYAPLLDWIAERTDLTAGVKLFYSACLRRARTAAYAGVKRNWLRRDKLIEATGQSEWTANKYIRILTRNSMIVYTRGDIHLVGPKGVYLDQLSDEDYRVLWKSRIPAALMMNTGLSDQAVVLYGRLCGLAGKEGWWFGSKNSSPDERKPQTGLAEACGCTKNTLLKALHELEENNLIRVDRYGRGTGRRPQKPDGTHQHGGGQNKYWFLGHELLRFKPTKPRFISSERKPKRGVARDWQPRLRERLG